MSCTRCSRARAKLIEVYESSWTEYKKEENVQCLQRKSNVCGECLVGKTIPAFRKSTGVWQMGQVESFDWKKQHHRVRFDTNSRESLLVPSRPFLEYVACVKRELGNRRKKARIEPENNSDLPVDSSLICSPIREEHETGDHLIFRDEQFSFTGEDSKDTSEETKASIDSLDDSKSLQDVFEDEWVDVVKGTSYDDEKSQTSDVSAILLDYKPCLALDDEKENESSTKTCPRLWNKAEDSLLLEAVNATPDNETSKWPSVAQKITGRTGKQCRERFLNHLKPNLRRNTEWSPAEDALIFHLVNSIGTRWSSIAKLLPGRSDNAAKNRYHIIRRKLERLLTFLSSCEGQEAGETNPLLVLDSQDMSKHVSAAVDAIIALRSRAFTLPSEWSYAYDFTFGPYLLPSVVQDTVCKRCSLAVPSPQTGRRVCAKLGWCESCIKSPPFVSDNILRKLHACNASSAEKPAEMPHEEGLNVPTAI